MTTHIEPSSLTQIAVLIRYHEGVLNINRHLLAPPVIYITEKTIEALKELEAIKNGVEAPPGFQKKTLPKEPEITLNEAIEWLQLLPLPILTKEDYKNHRAVRLGIEALKIIRQWRKGYWISAPNHLRGETKE